MSTVQCPHCERKLCDENGLYMHVKAKHGRKAAKALPRPEREMSMGELVAQAQLEKMCGEPLTNPWIAEMFDL